MRYNTGNPVGADGSSSPFDLHDNSGNIDILANDRTKRSHPDRLGVSRKTYYGMEQDFTELIGRMGYELPYLAYGAGVVIDRQTQLVQRDGELYQVMDVDELPLTLTGNWSTDALKIQAVGDAALRQALASASGAELVWWNGFPISESLPVFPENFGAVGDGVADDAGAVQAWLNSLPAGSIALGKAGSKYRIKNGIEVNVPGTRLAHTQFIYPKSDFTYYHGVRVNADDCQLIGLSIETPNTLVRNETGFAISVMNVSNCLITGCKIRDTASAGIWVTNSDGVRIEVNYLFYQKADGIHFSDGCRNFTCTGNTITGTHDDAIAVVGDVPGDSLTPSIGAIIGNTVDGTVAGHGILLLACSAITVDGNTTNGTAYAGLGSYFWNLSGEPEASDWANDCLITNNNFNNPALAPANKYNNCGIFAGAFRNSQIKGNKVDGAKAEPTIGGSPALASCIQVLAMQGLLIEGNELRNSLSYGVWSPDNNVNEAVNHAELHISENRFYNVAKEIVRVQTAASGVGDLIVTDNKAYKCGYDGATTSLTTIGKVGSNLLNMSGNRNIDGSKGFAYDPATCTNIRVSDNTPEIPIRFTPGAVPTGGSWTSATSTGSYVERGQLVFFRVRVVITTKGTGTGCRINFPKSMRGGNPPVIIIGRNANTGQILSGSLVSLTQFDVFTYNNADPSTGDGQTIDISGWFERA